MNWKNKVHKPLLILLLLSQSQGIFAQFKTVDSLPTTMQLLKYDGLSALGGLKKAYTQPLKWKKDDFLIAGAIFAGTAVLYIYDEETTEWFIDQEPDIPEIIKDFGWYYGSPQNNYAINGAVYLYGLISKNEKVRKTGVLLISAASTAGIIQSFSKTIVGRARPLTGAGKDGFKPFSNEGAYHTFPSGHTILSFTTAYAIGKQFENPFIKGGIYALGMVAPISRLWAGAHWVTDVALSMAISIVVVDSIDNYLNQERDYGDLNKNRTSWKLNVGLGRVGITGTF